MNAWSFNKSNCWKREDEAQFTTLSVSNAAKVHHPIAAQKVQKQMVHVEKK